MARCGDYMIILFVIIIGATIIACLIVKLADLFMCYYTDDRCAKISFKSFKRFYEINQDRWELHGSYVKCIDKDRKYSYTRVSERFDFSFIDFIKYDLWRKSIRKSADNKRKMESTATMLELVKKDIAQFEDKANTQTDQAADNLKRIINNM